MLASLEAPDGRARVCLPGPHPAVRPLFAAGWRHGDSDVFMASDPGCSTRGGRCPTPAAPDLAGTGRFRVIQSTPGRPAGMPRLMS